MPSTIYIGDREIRPPERLWKPRSVLLKRMHKIRTSASEAVATIMDPSNPDYLDAIATELGMDTVTPRMVHVARKEIYSWTQGQLVARGLPEQFPVYRGKDFPEHYVVIPVTLCPWVALSFEIHHRFLRPEEKPPAFAEFIVYRDDVLADIDALRLGPGYEECELLVNKNDLIFTRMVSDWQETSTKPKSVVFAKAEKTYPFAKSGVPEIEGILKGKIKWDSFGSLKVFEP